MICTGGWDHIEKKAGNLFTNEMTKITRRKLKVFKNKGRAINQYISTTNHMKLIE